MGIAHVDRTVPELKNDLFRSCDESVSIRVLNSQQKSDLFHFKVMELKVHEDTKGYSCCKVRFHFLFELLRKRVNDKLQIFEWNVNQTP